MEHTKDGQWHSPENGTYPRRAQMADIDAVIDLSPVWPPLRWEVTTPRHNQRLAGEAEQLKQAELAAERAMTMMLEECKCDACRAARSL